MSGFRYSSGDRPLDGYTIEHALGRGGFGEVYFAKSDAGREVALKVIQNYEDIELRGVTHCMNLKSSHLVTIFDVKHDSDNRPWVVMEYVAGPCLKELLDEAAGDVGGANNRGKGIGEDQAMYFMRELIKGMRYLHDSGVVHRDLKPHNIFFEDGTVKIGDYSLSKAITTSHRSGHTTTVGSVHYMAPEIGEGKYGKAVDIYAMGVILFEMLTGNPPYVGESMGEVLIKHLTQTPDVEGLKPIFGRVITKAMARKPEDRFQSVDEMLHALCPDDHSSYLPAPASLSMIGDRATNRRAKALAKTDMAEPGIVKEGLAKAEVGPWDPIPQIFDTLVKKFSLVDTKEDSQSQPFARPRLAVPNLDSLSDSITSSVPSWLPGWLDFFGLWWQPPKVNDSGSILKGDPVSLLRRGITAVVVSLLFATFAFFGIRMHNYGTVMVFFLFPLLGMAACLGLLLALPRDNALKWILYNRLVSVLFFYGLLEFAFTGIPISRLGAGIESDAIPAVVITGLLFDWRCFIATTRIPRVGVIKTLTVMLVFFFLLAITGCGSPGSAMLGLLTIASVSLSIQIFAPHGRIAGPQSNVETRLDNESFVLKEEI